jgi:hypothetical protein
MWVWWDAKPNILGFSYTLNSSTYGSGELSNQTFLVSVVCWALIHVGVARCQTQYSWVHLYAEPKYIWIWQVVKSITFGDGVILSSNAYGTDNHNKPYIGFWDFVCLFLWLLNNKMLKVNNNYLFTPLDV